VGLRGANTRGFDRSNDGCARRSDRSADRRDPGTQSPSGWGRRWTVSISQYSVYQGVVWAVPSAISPRSRDARPRGRTPGRRLWLRAREDAEGGGASAWGVPL